MNSISTVCFTGHREIPTDIAINIPSALKKLLEQMIIRGAVNFRAGGAMGFDTICALCVLELKEKYPHVKLDLILPCKNQTKGWDEGSVRAYNYILEKADSIRYITEKYRSGCMLERNRALVDGSDVCVAFLMRSSGGSAYTYTYAIKCGIEVVNLYYNI